MAGSLIVIGLGGSGLGGLAHGFAGVVPQGMGIGIGGIGIGAIGIDIGMGIGIGGAQGFVGV